MALPRCSAARAGLKIGRARRPTQATRAAWGRRPPQRQSRRDWNVPRPLPSRRRPADCDAKAHGCPSTAQTLPNSTRLTSTHGDQRRERSESFRAKFMGVGVQGRVPPKVIPNAARRVRIPPSPLIRGQDQTWAGVVGRSATGETTSRQSRNSQQGAGGHRISRSSRWRRPWYPFSLSASCRGAVWSSARWPLPENDRTQQPPATRSLGPAEVARQARSAEHPDHGKARAKPRPLRATSRSIASRTCAPSWRALRVC